MSRKLWFPCEIRRKIKSEKGSRLLKYRRTKTSSFRKNLRVSALDG